MTVRTIVVNNGTMVVYLSRRGDADWPLSGAPRAPQVGTMAGGKPDKKASGRVSPMAPASKSESTNVWRLLESKPDFRDGMERARDDFAQGRTARARDVLKRPR